MRLRTIVTACLVLVWTRAQSVRALRLGPGARSLRYGVSTDDNERSIDINNEIIQQLRNIPNEISGDEESASSQQQQPACDIRTEALVLHCARSLVAYIAEQQSATALPHPPLQQISQSCQSLDEFHACTADVAAECRQRVAGHTMNMYDMLCQPQMRAQIEAQTECLSRMSADTQLAECQATAMQQQQQQLLRANASNASEGVGSTTTMTNDTAPTQPATKQCAAMQSYLDCLVKLEYQDTRGQDCKDAMHIQQLLLDEIDPSCDVSMVIPEPDPSRPECDEAGVCSCQPGFALDADTNKCQDVDECAEQPSRCSQRCVNLDATFECQCEAPYYVLDDDNVTCVRNDTEPLWIFFAHGQSIWNISQDGKDFQLQRAGLQKTAMIDLDMKERRLFYADIGANKIETMLLDGVFPKTIQFYEVEGTEGIAVDWIARNLYSLRKTDIWVQKLDGRFRRKLYSGVMKLPRALVVDPRNGYMYVTDWGSNAFIARAALDGSSFEPLITEGVVWPNALALDHYSDRLYWADAFLDTIEACDLDGSNRRTIVSESSSVPHVFGMAIADEHVYWTDWTYRGILRADKRTGANVTVLAQTALLPYSIKVYHPAMQPDAPNPCEALSCSQLCLLSPNANQTIEAMCACAEGFALQPDGYTCKSECTDEQILCGGSDPRCISRVYWCDGQSQCWDHEDERDCPRRVCLPGQFQCHDNKQCLQASNVCDGTPQCQDASDETYC